MASSTRPISSARSRRSLKLTAMSAPSRASVRAVLRPMPRPEAPVTSATRPCSSIRGLAYHAGRSWPTAERTLAGKVALVTGGSRGIGRACALKFAQLGADVAVNYSRNAEDAEATGREAKELGVRAVSFRADMGDRDAGLDLFRRLGDE